VTSERATFGYRLGWIAGRRPTIECRPWITPEGRIAGWRLPALTFIGISA
jgi:hypothetical protein